MDTDVKDNAVVNPSEEDERRFRKVVENVERINDLRDETLRTISNIKDPELKKVAKFTFEMPHESATKL